MENNHFIENEPLAAEDDGAPLPEAVETVETHLAILAERVEQLA